jgi:hypothetical protein
MSELKHKDSSHVQIPSKVFTGASYCCDHSFSGFLFQDQKLGYHAGA